MMRPCSGSVYAGTDSSDLHAYIISWSGFGSCPYNENMGAIIVNIMSCQERSVGDKELPAVLYLDPVGKLPEV